MSNKEFEIATLINLEDMREKFGKTDEQGLPAIDSVLSIIETEAKKIVFDINTKEGQSICRSLAAKVAKAKNALDTEGKLKKEEYTKFTSRIDSDRRLSKKRMQDLQDLIRQPLTDLEASEALRIENHTKNLESINPDNLVYWDLPSAQLKEMLSRVEAFEIDDSWQEFKIRAANYKDRTVKILNDAIAKAEASEAEKAELEQLRAESAERAKRDREEALIKKAKEEAKAEAEAEAQAKIDAESSKAAAEAQAKIDESNERERQANEREAAAKAEATKAQQEAAEAIERAEAAAAEQKRQEEARIASEKQKAKDEEAKAQEELRLHKEKQKAEAAQKKADAKRQADKKYINDILEEAAADLVKAGLSEDAAKIAIQAIYECEVTNTMISI